MTIQVHGESREQVDALVLALHAAGVELMKTGFSYEQQVRRLAEALQYFVSGVQLYCGSAAYRVDDAGGVYKQGGGAHFGSHQAFAVYLQIYVSGNGGWKMLTNLEETS